MIFAENSVLIRILLSSIKIFLLARFFLKIVPFTFTENSNFPQLISFPQNIFLEKINFSSFNFVLFFASDRMWSQVRYDLATSWRRTLYNHKTTKRGKFHSHETLGKFSPGLSSTEKPISYWGGLRKKTAEKFSLWGAVHEKRKSEADEDDVVVGKV